jgi:hypothetical protein
VYARGSLAGLTGLRSTDGRNGEGAREEGREGGSRRRVRGEGNSLFVHDDAVVVLATSVTAATRVLAVLTDATVTVGHVAAVLASCLQTSRLRWEAEISKGGSCGTPPSTSATQGCCSTVATSPRARGSWAVSAW